MRLLELVTPLFQRTCDAIMGNSRSEWVWSRIRRSNKYASTYPDFCEEEMGCGLIQKCLENPVEFRRREVMNDDFPATFPFLDHDFSAESFLQSLFNIRPGCSP